MAVVAQSRIRKNRAGTKQTNARGGLNQLSRLGDLDRPLTLEEVYRAGGVIAELADTERFHSRRGGPRFRELHRALGGCMPLTAIHRCYSIYTMLTRLGIPPEFEHIGPTHLRNIATLPPNKQAAAIRRAEKERSSHREIEERTSYREGKLVRGRRGSPRFARLVRDLSRFAQEPLGRLTRLDDVDRLSPDDTAELIEILRATERRSARLLTKLEKHRARS